MAEPFRNGREPPPPWLPSNFPAHHQHLNFPQNVNRQSFNPFVGGFRGYSQRPRQPEHTFWSTSSPLLLPQSHSPSHSFSPQNQSQQVKRKDVVAHAENAATAAHSNLLSTGQSVSVCKIVQSMLSILKVDSLDSLGIRIQDISYLRHIVSMEGRINAFVECYVAVRRIITLYDLRDDICRFEGVEDFEKLCLGPLVRHPLIVHYFEPPEDMLTVFKITTDTIVSYLSDFLYKHHDKEIQVDEFLSVVAKKQKVSSPKELCIRINCLRTHVGIIQRIKQAEKDLACTIEAKIAKEREIERKKKAYELESKIITESDTDDDEFLYSKEETIVSSKKRKVDYQFQNSRGSCPCPSAGGEKDRLKLKGNDRGLNKRWSMWFKSIEHGNHLAAQKSTSASSDPNEDRGGKKSPNVSRRKRKAFKSKMSLATSPCQLTEEETSPVVQELSTEVLGNVHANDFELTDRELIIFVAAWKNICQEKSVFQVFKTMMELQSPVDKKGRNVFMRDIKKLSKLFTMEPAVSLLNVSVKLSGYSFVSPCGLLKIIGLYYTL